MFFRYTNKLFEIKGMGEDAGSGIIDD